jgi:3-dehydroquinate dehydratase type I
MNTTDLTNTYCLPIIKDTKAQVLATIESNLSRYHFFEVWLDYICDAEPSFAEELATRLPNRIIVIFRRQNFEAPRLPLDTCLSICKSLVGRQVLVDFDIVHQAREIDLLKTGGITLSTILSYHNYSETPSDTELHRITTRARELGAQITKVSTFCLTPSDALRLLTLLLNLRDAGRRCVILGMGEHGVATRIFGHLWGNALSFAPCSIDECSAPGQIPLDNLNSIMQALTKPHR